MSLDAPDHPAEHAYSGASGTDTAKTLPHGIFSPFHRDHGPSADHREHTASGARGQRGSVRRLFHSVRARFHGESTSAGDVTASAPTAHVNARERFKSDGPHASVAKEASQPPAHAQRPKPEIPPEAPQNLAEVVDEAAKSVMVRDGAEGAVKNEPRKPEAPSVIPRERVDASEKPADARTARDTRSSDSAKSIGPQELERLRKRFQEQLRAPEVNQKAMPLDWPFPAEAPGTDAPATRSSPERGKLRAVRSHSSSPPPLSLDSPAEPPATNVSQGKEAPAKFSPIIPSITITHWEESSASSNSPDGRKFSEARPTATEGGQASSTKSSSGVQGEELPATATDPEQTGSNGSDLVSELHRCVRIRVQRRPDQYHSRMQRERFLREATSRYEANPQPPAPF